MKNESNKPKEQQKAEPREAVKLSSGLCCALNFTGDL